MIKAPFRFDVEYFSLIVMLKTTLLDKKMYFQNEQEKQQYLKKMKKQGKSNEEL